MPSKKKARKKAAGVLTDPLPLSESYNRIDKIVIICLIGIFLFLFIWFSVRARPAGLRILDVHRFVDVDFCGS